MAKIGRELSRGARKADNEGGSADVSPDPVVHGLEESMAALHAEMGAVHEDMFSHTPSNLLRD